MHVELTETIKIIFILACGNAHVKFGVSINKGILTEGKSESTCVAQRIVYDGVMNDESLLKLKWIVRLWNLWRSSRCISS